MLKVLDFWLCLLMRFQLLTISLGYQCMCMSCKDGRVPILVTWEKVLGGAGAASVPKVN